MTSVIKTLGTRIVIKSREFLRCLRKRIQNIKVRKCKASIEKLLDEKRIISHTVEAIKDPLSLKWAIIPNEVGILKLYVVDQILYQLDADTMSALVKIPVACIAILELAGDYKQKAIDEYNNYTIAEK